jgi:hypothetical protein
MGVVCAQYVCILVVGLGCLSVCLSVPDMDMNMNMDSEKCDEDSVCVEYNCIVL